MAKHPELERKDLQKMNNNMEGMRTNKEKREYAQNFTERVRKDFSDLIFFYRD